MMFAEDLVLCVMTHEEVEEDLETRRLVFERHGLKINRTRTEYLPSPIETTVNIVDAERLTVTSFKYLALTNDGGSQAVKTRLDHMRHEHIRKEAHVKPVETFLENKILNWFGHCSRRERNHICAKSLRLEVYGRRSRGRPKKIDAGTTYRETWRNINWLKTWRNIENTGWLKFWPAMHKEMVKKGEKGEKTPIYNIIIIFATLNEILKRKIINSTVSSSSALACNTEAWSLSG